MDEPDPNDEEFCPILWQANGGKVRDNGSPIFDGDLVRGRCREPGDCDHCTFMRHSLMAIASQGVTSLWICPSCVGQISNSARELGLEVKLPGFYSEGFCQRPQCHRNGDERYSIVLQLLTVIGTTIP